jgi:acetyl esterase/lipase
MDVWLARSQRPSPLVVYIHGGGFSIGDKKPVPSGLLDGCLEHSISVAAINYRYATQAPYPAPMQDGARAVQYLRSRAREWNLKPDAFAATGVSAGAGIALWIAFRDDMADPNSSDPVSRQSTRLRAAGPVDGQTAYDPRIIARLIDEKTSRHHALPRLFGLRAEEMNGERAHRLFEEASALTHLTADDPPVFLYYGYPMEIPPRSLADGIHSPQFGIALKERMDKLGIECQLHLKNEYGGEPTSRWYYRQMVDFFHRHLNKN